MREPVLKRPQSPLLPPESFPGDLQAAMRLSGVALFVFYRRPFDRPKLNHQDPDRYEGWAVTARSQPYNRYWAPDLATTDYTPLCTPPNGRGFRWKDHRDTLITYLASRLKA